MSARVHPQASGRARGLRGGSSSGRMGNLLAAAHGVGLLEQEHRRLDLFEYLVSFNAEQAAKPTTATWLTDRVASEGGESCPMASAIRRAGPRSRCCNTTELLFGKEARHEPARRHRRRLRAPRDGAPVGELDWEKPRQLYVLVTTLRIEQRLATPLLVDLGRGLTSKQTRRHCASSIRIGRRCATACARPSRGSAGWLGRVDIGVAAADSSAQRHAR